MFVRDPLNAKHLIIILVTDNTVCDHYKKQHQQFHTAFVNSEI